MFQNQGRWCIGYNSSNVYVLTSIGSFCDRRSLDQGSVFNMFSRGNGPTLYINSLPKVLSLQETLQLSLEHLTLSLYRSCIHGCL